jgi:hypothetical protein
MIINYDIMTRMGDAFRELSGPNVLYSEVVGDPLFEVSNSEAFLANPIYKRAPEMELQIPEVSWRFGPRGPES